MLDIPWYDRDLMTGRRIQSMLLAKKKRSRRYGMSRMAGRMCLCEGRGEKIIH